MKAYMKSVALTVAAVCCVIAPHSFAQTAITPGALNVGGAGPYELGFNFSVNSPISITTLGAFDAGSNGLTQSHVVSIWTSGGTLLGSATITGGNAGTAQNGFQYAAVTPFTLNSGSSYIIGASNFSSNGDNYAYDYSRTVSPQITFNNSLFQGSSSSVIPTSNGGSTLYYGANFQFVDTAPEPSTWILIGVGMFGAGAMLRRRRNFVTALT